MADTALLYLDDCYKKECESKVDAVSDGGLVLNQTVFYYTSGGQPSDVGKITRIKDGLEFEVKEVRKINGSVVHILDSLDGFEVGDEINCEIDWNRRYKLMRTHTAGHVLASIMFKRGGILITGNQLGVEHARFDFSMEDFDRGFIDSCVNEANEECRKGHGVETFTLAREEAMKIVGMVKLAGALPPNLERLRIVKIGELDTQADGGTHVRNTKEVGEIEFEKAENKGAINRRIYFRLKD